MARAMLIPRAILEDDKALYRENIRFEAPSHADRIRTDASIRFLEYSACPVEVSARTAVHEAVVAVRDVFNMQ